MSDYHFFYVDVDGITIRPPYPLRSESERRILGIDDFCWAYEAACTVTYQPRPAANRKARFDSRELNMYYWREAVNMVKDCLTKQKYYALGDISWLDDRHLVRELNNGGSGEIDTSEFNNGVFNKIFEEENLFISASELDENSADFFSRVNSKSRILEGIGTFWENVNKLSLFFGNNGICQVSGNIAVISKGVYRIQTKKFASGRTEVSEPTPLENAQYYSIDYKETSEGQDPDYRLVEETNGSSVASSVNIINNVFATYVVQLIFTRYLWSNVQKWDYGMHYGYGDMTYRYYVGEKILEIDKGDGVSTASGTEFNVSPEFCSYNYCKTIMGDMGLDFKDTTKVASFTTISQNLGVILKMEFPWTTEV